MNWQKEFYQQQFNWTKKWTSFDMTLLYDDLVEKVAQQTRKHDVRILELGGGSGQFAIAAAKKGYEVTVIEMVSECVTHMKQLKRDHHIGDHLTIIKGDFYEVALSEEFDVVCYWDGFGIGSDNDQKRLLKRIEEWLVTDGIALIDVYTPWYWSRHAGQTKQHGKIHTTYDYNPYENRMVDTWKLEDNDHAQTITQSLRCYAPSDFKLLLDDVNLSLTHVEPGGAMDYDQGLYHPNVPLEQAMMYIAHLIKS